MTLYANTRKLQFGTGFTVTEPDSHTTRADLSIPDPPVLTRRVIVVTINQPNQVINLGVVQFFDLVHVVALVDLAAIAVLQPLDPAVTFTISSFPASVLHVTVRIMTEAPSPVFINGRPVSYYVNGYGNPSQEGDDCFTLRFEGIVTSHKRKAYWLIRQTVPWNVMPTGIPNFNTFTNGLTFFANPEIIIRGWRDELFFGNQLGETYACVMYETDIPNDPTPYGASGYGWYALFGGLDGSSAWSARCIYIGDRVDGDPFGIPGASGYFGMWIKGNNIGEAAQLAYFLSTKILRPPKTYAIYQLRGTCVRFEQTNYND